MAKSDGTSGSNNDKSSKKSKSSSDRENPSRAGSVVIKSERDSMSEMDIDNLGDLSPEQQKIAEAIENREAKAQAEAKAKEAAEKAAKQQDDEMGIRRRNHPIEPAKPSKTKKHIEQLKKESAEQSKEKTLLPTPSKPPHYQRVKSEKKEPPAHLSLQTPEGRNSAKEAATRFLKGDHSRIPSNVIVESDLGTKTKAYSLDSAKGRDSAKESSKRHFTSFLDKLEEEQQSKEKKPEEAKKPRKPRKRPDATESQSDFRGSVIIRRSTSDSTDKSPGKS